MSIETTVTCSSCGGTLDGSTNCPYCRNIVIPDLITRKLPEKKLTKLLSEYQVGLVNKYLNGQDEYKGNMRAVLYALMINYDDQTLSDLLRPLIEPNSSTWNVEWIANTKNRNNRNYDLTQHFFAHGIEKKILKSLPREMEVTVS